MREPTGPPPFVGEGRPWGESGCCRWLGDRNCDKPSVMHVCWTDDMENGGCCLEHWAEAQERWTFIDHHTYEGFCGMPETIWIWSWAEPPGMCVFPLSDEGVQDVLIAKLDLPIEEPAMVPR